MVTETLRLRSGGAEAWIDAAGFGCSSLVVGEWQVLGEGGMRVLFPWVGTQAARPARLRLGGNEVAIGGGAGEALAGGGWRLGSRDEHTISADLHTIQSDAYPFELALRA